MEQLHPFDPTTVLDFEKEMKKRVHPVVLDFIHSGKKRMLHFAEIGFKVYAEDLVNPYQEKRSFLTAKSRVERGKGRDELHRLKYADGFFDGVYCWNFFNYFTPDDGLFLIREIWRVLKVGGVLAVTFAALKNIPEADQRTIVLTTDRFVDEKAKGNRLLKIYENREIENLLSAFRLLRVITQKNGNRKVLAIKAPVQETGPADIFKMGRLQPIPRPGKR